MKRLLAFALVAVVALAMAGVAAAATHVVKVRNFEFAPDNLVIEKGDTVRWEWESGSHTVTNGTGPSDPQSGTQFNANSTSGEPTFEFIFNDVGDFPYYCIPHFAAGMTGQVSVEEGTAVDGTTWSQIKRIFDRTAPGGKVPS